MRQTIIVESDIDTLNTSFTCFAVSQRVTVGFFLTPVVYSNEENDNYRINKTKKN
jgi:hypothetical protein